MGILQKQLHQTVYFSPLPVVPQSPRPPWRRPEILTFRIFKFGDLMFSVSTSCKKYDVPKLLQWNTVWWRNSKKPLHSDLFIPEIEICTWSSFWLHGWRLVILVSVQMSPSLEALLTILSQSLKSCETLPNYLMSLGFCFPLYKRRVKVLPTSPSFCEN